jgi:hypothetical protein
MANFVLFTSNRTGGTNLWRTSLDGAEVSELSHGDSEMTGQLTSDDEWLVFISLESGKLILHKMSIDGTQDTILSQVPVEPRPPYRPVIMPFNGGNPTAMFNVPGPTPGRMDARWQSAHLYCITERG